MGYSLKGSTMIAVSKVDNKGTAAQRASDGDKKDDGDADIQHTSSHGFSLPAADRKDQEVVVVERTLNPSNSGTSISSMNVVSNDSCKKQESQAVGPVESRIGSSSQSLEEIERRQEETSPHPPCNPSSSSSKASQLGSNSSNREKASPVSSHRFVDSQTTSVHKQHVPPVRPPVIGFRPSQHPHSGYRPAPPPYQRHHYHPHDPRFHHPHHPPYAGVPAPGQRYYGYSTPRRGHLPSVYHATPAHSVVGSKEGMTSKPSNVEDANLASMEGRRAETLPLKKRKMVGFPGERVGAMKAISVDDREAEDKANESAHHGHDEHTYPEHQSWEEEKYAHYHAPRYGGPYPPPYHHNGHYYSPYHPPESDYYSPPRSHRHRQHYRQAPHDYPHHHRPRQHTPVSLIDEDCGSNDDVPTNETIAESVKQECSSSLDKLASAAGTLEIRSEASVKSEGEDGESGDDDKSDKKEEDHRKCTPICTSMLTKYLTQKDIVLLPAFAEIVNFPEHLPEKASPSKKNGKSSPTKQPSEKPCVMCGVTCIFAGTTPSRLHAQMKQPIIPKQNKGLCNSCDGKTWIFTELNSPIKWCKGCKNFRSLRNFGDKYRATKCVRCRQRQRENYAELKRKRDAQIEGASLLVQQKSGWGSASDESERGSPELDAAIALATLIS